MADGRIMEWWSLEDEAQVYPNSKVVEKVSLKAALAFQRCTLHSLPFPLPGQESRVECTNAGTIVVSVRYLTFAVTCRFHLPPTTCACISFDDDTLSSCKMKELLFEMCRASTSAY